MYLYIYMVTTNGFCNFLGNQHWPLMNTENDYRLVLNFSWKSALITDENTQSLKIGSVIFLEISTDPPKESTVCFFFESTFFRNQGHYRSVLQDTLGNQNWSAMNTENDYKSVLIFSCKSALGTLSTPNHYKLVFQFWFIIFLAKTESALFKNQVTTDRFINICCFTLWS